jgi:methionyl-tRNA formyltransferase
VTHPYPGAFTSCRTRRLFVWQARLVDDRVYEVPGEVLARDGGIVVATGSGALRLERVQLDGEAEEAGDRLAQRIGLRIGDRLGEEAA